MSALDWQQRYSHDPWQLIHHAVAITGYVTDVRTGAPIAGAQIQISQGPPAFRARLATLARAPDWEQQAERVDRRLSRPDGRYFFLDLPVGTYRLQVSAPRLGSRYGQVVLNAVQVVAEREPSGRLKLAAADAALPPTCISGRVTSNDTQLPVVGAKVRLRGDTRSALTDAEGRYLLSGLVKGTPTIEVSAKSFVTKSQAASLSAGQELTVDVALTPGA